jgi:hypothetical protein
MRSANSPLDALVSSCATYGTDLAAYLRLDCLATLARAYDANLEHGALAGNPIAEIKSDVPVQPLVFCFRRYERYG